MVKRMQLTTNATLYYRTDYKEPVIPRKTPEEKSYEDKVKVVKQKAKDTDPQNTSSSMSVTKL